MIIRGLCRFWKLLSALTVNEIRLSLKRISKRKCLNVFLPNFEKIKYTKKKCVALYYFSFRIFIVNISMMASSILFFKCFKMSSVWWFFSTFFAPASPFSSKNFQNRISLVYKRIHFYFLGLAQGRLNMNEWIEWMTIRLMNEFPWCRSVRVKSFFFYLKNLNFFS